MEVGFPNYPEGYTWSQTQVIGVIVVVASISQPMTVAFVSMPQVRNLSSVLSIPGAQVAGLY